VSALHARWWQIESWLRSLVHVEMGARYGHSWVTSLPAAALKRASDDRGQPYMAGPDATSEYVVSYLDVFDLFSLIEREWDLFSYALPRREAWTGRVRELRDIRHRIAHCRLPHQDDLGRLLQALRDLEHGARAACAAFNDTEFTSRLPRDPIARQWGASPPPDKQHLIDHAHRKYETSFALRWSKRPWLPAAPQRGRITGVAGCLWHARWIVRQETINPIALWNDYYLDDFRDDILLMTFGGSRVEVVFSALEDPRRIVDAIEQIFQAILSRENYAEERMSRIFFDPLVASSLLLPPKVQVATPWVFVDDTIHEYDIFSARS